MGEYTCKCTPLKEFDDKYYIPEVYDEKALYEVEFQPIPANTTTNKTISILNTLEVPCNFFVKRENLIPFMYRAFKVKENQGIVNPSCSCEIKITFAPKLSNENFFENIQIYNSETNAVYNILLKGFTVGPNVISSMVYILFNYSLRKQDVKHIVELKNDSPVTAIYQFDLESKEMGVYKIDTLKGEIKSGKHTYISLSFKPKKPGIYCRDLVCLIIDQEPLVFYLVGIYFPKEVIDDNKILLNQYDVENYENNIGYNYYFKTSIISPEDIICPITFESLYIDYEKTPVNLPTEDDNPNFSTKTIFCANHLQKNMVLSWEDDPDKIVSVSPKEILLENEAIVYIDCNFFPTSSDTVYSKTIKGSVYWANILEHSDLDIINIPIFFDLTIIGNTFSSTCMWLPRIEMCPTVITLPPVLPGGTSYTTFMLKSSGHLPVLFKFLSPKYTNISIKPMMGTITDHHIFAVKLRAAKEIEKTYFENWKVVFNDREECFYQFTLQCCSRSLKLIIGNEDVVRFGTIYSGSEVSIRQPIFNPTIHTIQYSFLLDDDSFIKIDKYKDKIGPNERKFLTWSVTANVKTPQEMFVQYEMRVLQRGEAVTGKPLIGTVTVYLRSEYSVLCAFPKSHDFGEVQYGKLCETKFEIFNFSEATIHFTLVWDETHPEFKVSIKPKTGSLKHMDKCLICVSFLAKQMGKYNLNVHYKIRKREDSKELINDDMFDIFYSELVCLYPAVQIVDIAGYNFGHLFSKLTLWELLKIDRLNEIMRTIEANQIKTLEVNLPDFEEGDDIYNCTLILKNISNFDCEFSLKLTKMCGCPSRTVSVSMTRRKVVTTCDHTEMVKFSATNNNVVAANSFASIKITVKYIVPETSRFLYEIHLGDKRSINLYISLRCLTNLTVLPSTYYPHFTVKFAPTFIGLKDPEMQEYRLYNNTANALQFVIDTTPFVEINFDCKSPILECLNPCDIIPSYSSMSIFFKFRPIEERMYNVSTVLELKDQRAILGFCGMGKKQHEIRGKSFETNMPIYSDSFNLENLVEFSIDHLVIEAMDLWSEEERLIFIKNLSQEDIIGYSWENQCVPGILYVQPGYKKGILKPKEIQAVVIRVHSFDKPCRLIIQIPCALLNHTQYVAFKKSEQINKLVKERRKHEFCITEKGMEYPVVDESIDVERPKVLYTSLAITLDIISSKDKDLCIPISKQLRLSPQIFLHLNAVEICEDYYKTIQKYFPGSFFDFNKTNSKQDETKKIEFPKEKVELLKNVSECLIADAIFNKLFGSILQEQSECNAPYYYQFKPRDEILQKEYKTTRNDFQLRKKLINGFLKRPQSHFIVDTFKEIIFENIHEIFLLGPPPKARSNKQYIPELKNKFSLPPCSCPKFGDNYNPNI